MNTFWSLVVACVLTVSITPRPSSPSETPAQRASPTPIAVSPAWYLERIGAPAADRQPQTPVIVAIIDAGVDISAPLLQGRIADTVNIVAPDPLHDESGHGTHTAGIIAARSDASGIRGICDGCRLLILKAITNDGYGSDLTVARAIAIAIERGAQVINLSIGGPSDTAAIRNAIADAVAADIVVVAAAGNNTGAPLQRSYPAAYPGVIAVSAVDQSNQLAAFARADASIDLVAPGVDIFNIDTSAAGMGSADGTSTAAPQVSAAAALLRAHYPSASAATIRSALLQSATDLGPLGRDDAYGYGLLHIPRALAVLKQAQTQIPPH
jgi:subtilisin family serine protease